MTPGGHAPLISVMLAVPDAAAAAQWYAQGLGATKLWNLGSVVGLTIEGPRSSSASLRPRGAVGIHRQGGFIDPFGHLWLVGDRSPLSSHGPR